VRRPDRDARLRDMGYVLDTADLPAHERLEAVRAAMMYASAPCHVLHENPDGDVRARMEVWDFGAATIFTQRSTGIRLLRTAKLARQDEMPVVALAVQHRVDGRIEQHGRQRVVAPGELLVVDVSAPYDYAWSGDGGAGCLQIPYDQLGLPLDLVRRAARSPAPRRRRAQPGDGRRRTRHLGTPALQALRGRRDQPRAVDHQRAAAARTAGIDPPGPQACADRDRRARLGFSRPHPFHPPIQGAVRDDAESVAAILGGVSRQRCGQGRFRGAGTRYGRAMLVLDTWAVRYAVSRAMRRTDAVLWPHSRVCS